MTQFFFVLLIMGILLIGLEIFIPGGVIGLLGAVSLIGSIIIAFQVFGAQYGALIAMGIIALLVLCLYLWIKYFPKSPVGKAMTLSQDMSQSPKENDDEYLLGKKGIAKTALHPAGIATIDDKRIDVVAESSWIAKGKSIRVIQVEGNHVTVRE